jgi:acyl-lipid omega-6 desaturase (Delta-12 desaturase)
MHERDPGIHATLDPRAWPPILARYREPNSARSTIELMITAVPFVILWILMCGALGSGYWVGLLLAVPAAGFLVLLFMIQHDCGHGSFLRRRLTNDWVGRVIGVLTLTYELGQSRSPRVRRCRYADRARVSGITQLASAPVPVIQASDRHVWRGSDVCVRLTAPTAGGTDAQ